MKQLACFLTAGAMLLTLCACSGSPASSPSPDPTPTVEPTPTPPLYTNPLTGEATDTDLSGQKPVTVVMNNIKVAMPQQGNSTADIIYEAIAEGGITRMLAVYQDPADLTTIGSVRSARDCFLDLALGHDGVFVHAGGSHYVYDTIAQLGVNDVDGVKGTNASGIFFRDPDRTPGVSYAWEHTLMADGKAMVEKLTANGLLGPHSEGYKYEMSFTEDGTPQDGQAANTITVTYSNYKNTVFQYNEDKQVYLVEQYDSPFIDGNDGSQISTTNVLVLQTDYSIMDDGYYSDVSLTSGTGYFACGGKMIPINWEKGDHYNQLRYYTQDGKPLTLGVGKSFVCIAPTSRDVVAE